MAAVWSSGGSPLVTPATPPLDHRRGGRRGFHAQLFGIDSRFGDSGGCYMDELSWAPAGEQLAFIGYRQDSSGPLSSQAHVVDLRGRTTQVALPTNVSATGLAYSPDGAQLAVAVADPDAATAAEASRIVTVDPAAPKASIQGEITQVPLNDASNPELAGHLHGSADGSTIVGEWGSYSFQRELLTVDIGAGTATTSMQAGEHEVLGVTDDGSRALVLTHDTNTDLLRLMPTNGGSATTIADGSVLENGHIWNASLDGSHVVFDDMNSTGFATEAPIWLSNVNGSQHTKLCDVDGVLAATPSLNAQRDAAAADRRDEER